MLTHSKITFIKFNRRRATLVAFWLLFHFFPGSLWPQEDSSITENRDIYFQPENIKNFADFLFRQGDYLRAANEYQRYLYYGYTDNLYHIHFQLGRCYFRIRSYDPATIHFQNAAATAPGTRQMDSVEVMLAATSLFNKNDTDFEAYSSKLGRKNISPQLTRQLTSLRVLSFIQKQQWETARNFLETTQAVGAPDDDTLSPLSTLVDRGANLELKSPWIAGLLSTLVPGSGKIYAARTFDGIYSLLLIGATSALAYEGFRDHGLSSGKGWIFGSIATFLYAGNIYGSTIAVHLRNNQLKKSIDDEIQTQLSIWFYF